MPRNKEQSGGKVVAFPAKKKATEKASEQKWGKNVMEHGFSIIPSLIFKAQARLGLTGMQLAIVLQLGDHWWEADRNPYPSKKTVAERLGIDSRTLQRHIAALEKAGYVKRIERLSKLKGKLSNEYDLSGLVKRLKEIEPDFREAREQKKQAARKGGLKAPRPKAG